MEKWDLYDNKLDKTNLSVFSDEEIPNGYYHMAIDIWIVNNEKKLMLVKNSIDYTKLYPDCWVNIGGNLLSDENIEFCIKRVLNDKLGLNINTFNYEIKHPVKRDPHKYAYMTCILFEDINIKNIELSDSNYADINFFTKDEVKRMCNNGEVAYYLIDRINDQIIDYLN